MHLIGNKAADAVVLKYSLLISEIHCIFSSFQESIFWCQNNDKSPNIYVLSQVLNSGFARCA